MDSVTYEGTHRKRKVVAKWTRNDDRQFPWKIAVAIDEVDPISKLIGCVPSWEASKRTADILTGDDHDKVQRKMKSLPDLKIVG